jgi:hypothetical protein
MNKEMVIAKIRQWQTELSEIVETLNQEKKSGPILELLKMRARDLGELIETIQDKSFIQPGDVEFEPAPVLDEIALKVRKVKEGVRKLKKLSTEEKKIIEDLEKDV